MTRKQKRYDLQQAELRHLNASKTWARDIRGIISIAKALTFRLAKASTTGLFWFGYRNEINVLPSFSISASWPNAGGLTFSKMFAAPKRCSLSTSVAPAAL